MIAALATPEGRVLELFASDKAGLADRYHPDLIAALRDVPNGTAVGAWLEGPPPAPAPTADDVRAEAERRMIALLGARDAAHLDILIANATREAVRLLRKGKANWATEEAIRASELQVLDDAIEAIRAGSNAMEASPPADYQSDERWPTAAG